MQRSRAMNRLRKLRQAASSVSISSLFAIQAMCGLAAQAGENCNGNPRDLFYQELKGDHPGKQITLAYAIELDRPGEAPRIVANGERFLAGDSIRLHVKCSEPLYLYMKCRQSSGQIASLYPPDGEDNRLEPGAEQVVPKKGMITFDEKPGREVLLLCVSRAPLAVRDWTALSQQEIPAVVTEHLTGRREPLGACSVIGGGNQNDPFVYVNQPDTSRLAVGVELNHGKASSSDSTSDSPEIPVQEANRPMSGKWALLVGVDKFAHVNPGATGCVSDVRNLSAFLMNEAGFRSDHVFSLTDAQATRANVMQSLVNMSSRIQPGDLVLLSFATHGTERSDQGLNYIATYDFRPDDPENSSIRMQDLSSQIKARIHSERIVVMVDTCFSGNVRKFENSEEFLRSVLLGCGHIIVSSCAPGEEACPAVDENGNMVGGLFTSNLISSWRKHRMLRAAFIDAGNSTVQAAKKMGHDQHPILNYSKWTGPDLDIYTQPAD